MTIQPEQVTAAIKTGGAITIIRGAYTIDFLRGLADILLEAGLGVLEVTLNSPDALQHIADLRAHVGERSVVGAGTVRAPEDVDRALDAGAQFLVSPHTDPAILARAQEANRLIVPGVFTPTEAASAASAGATMLKLFPASVVGPGYLSAIRAPLDDVDLVPVGGVNAANAAAFLRAGAVALGVGSWLIAPGRDLESVAARVDQLRMAIAKGRHNG